MYKIVQNSELNGKINLAYDCDFIGDISFSNDEIEFLKEEVQKAYSLSKGK